MKSISIKSKIITGAVLASMVVSGSTAVFASASSSSTDNNTSITQNNHKHSGVKTQLDDLVSQGKLTSEKATAVENALKPQGANKSDKADKLITKLDALVEAGTITSDEETIIISNIGGIT